ncbi:MAG: OadG family protein [Bacteroidales bacterium]|jgi:hypothetical protein|nr:OadG family protein [Bacteroidales bacterium]
MNKNIILSFVIAILSFFFANISFAQENRTNAQLQKEIDDLKHQIATLQNESYDPLIPQSFAADSKTNTIVTINKVENTLEILSISKQEGTNKKIIKKDTVILVDLKEGRHDLYAVYTPMSVAIYENHIVYLASNRDSSFVRVLTLEGNLKEEFRFNGAASAFSYDNNAKKLYIAGDNIAGYNVFEIDAENGFDNVNISNSPSLNYVRPKKADEIKKHDPTGGGLTLIAVLTVFSSLVIIFLVLKVFGKIIMAIQNRKDRKEKENIDKPKHKEGIIKNASDVSGEEFAAIATAIYLYNEELHDEEKAILTINKVAKVYSPWSSKMHNMNVYRR